MNIVKQIILKLLGASPTAQHDKNHPPKTSGVKVKPLVSNPMVIRMSNKLTPMELAQRRADQEGKKTRVDGSVSCSVTSISKDDEIKQKGTVLGDEPAHKTNIITGAQPVKVYMSSSSHEVKETSDQQHHSGHDSSSSHDHNN
ncbi:hypothetical protein fHeYen801_136c [Yersinia phage fHe-Yen8-01]|nr:hypothetical protein fHeYen801_136c [Yersinia phage fHe-Yen8-01]